MIKARPGGREGMEVIMDAYTFTLCLIGACTVTNWVFKLIERIG